MYKYERMTMYSDNKVLNMNYIQVGIAGLPWVHLNIVTLRYSAIYKFGCKTFKICVHYGKK